MRLLWECYEKLSNVWTHWTFSSDNNASHSVHVVYNRNGCSTGFAQCFLRREPLTATAGHKIGNTQPGITLIKIILANNKRQHKRMNNDLL